MNQQDNPKSNVKGCRRLAPIQPQPCDEKRTKQSKADLRSEGECAVCGQKFMQLLRYDHLEYCQRKAKWKQLFDTVMLLKEDETPAEHRDESLLQLLYQELAALSSALPLLLKQFNEKKRLAQHPKSVLRLQRQFQERERRASEADFRLAAKEGRAKFQELQAHPCGAGVGGECVICMVQFVQGAAVIRMPCLHLYHEQCIREWVRRSGDKSCPVDHFRLD